MERFRTVSSLVAYQGNNGIKKLRKFLKAIEKNMNNSTGIDSNLDTRRDSKGYTLKLVGMNGIKKVFPEGKQDDQKNYYIRYFINMYNSTNQRFYGNTFRSPLLKISFDGAGYIKLQNPEPFIAYVLSPDDESDNCIAQIIFVEATKEDVILSQSIEGWTIFRLKESLSSDPAANPGQSMPIRNSKIFLGSPRDLLYKMVSDLFVYEGASLDYVTVSYPQLCSIKFLLPDYVTMGSEEELPGLLFRKLPPVPKNEEIRTVNFDDVYLKDIEIEIAANLEEKILAFANKYRKEKYDIYENQFNKVFIKERRLKCGVHNTWCFINSNGLENSLTLLKKEDRLIYKGALLVDNFFSDELSSCAFILELNYTITVPIAENQKEENLSLPIGYSVFVPDRVSMENDNRSAYFISGPGMTVYGDHLWDPLELSDRMIKINFYLSKSKDPVEKVVQAPQVVKDNSGELENMRKNLTQNFNNELTRKVQENMDLRNKIRSLENLIDQQKNQQQREPLPRQEPEPPQYQESKIEQSFEAERERGPVKEPTIIRQEEDVVNQIPVQNVQIRQSQISQDDYDEFRQFQEYRKKAQFFKSSESVNKALEDQMEKSKVVYDQTVKDIAKRERADYISKGLLDLNIAERDNSLIEFTLQNELTAEDKGHLITFQFLAYKPRKDLKDLSLLPSKLRFKFDFWNTENIQTSNCTVSKPDPEIKYSYTPLPLLKEGSAVTYTDAEKSVLVQLKYDPSTEPSSDYRDFISYLLRRQMVVEVYDVEKCFLLGCIKVPLKDLVRQGKPQIYHTKEYELFDNEFNLKGYIQILLKSMSMKTKREFVYDRNLLRKLNSKDGYNTKTKKKKCLVRPIDINKLSNDEKSRIGEEMLRSQNLNDLRESQQSKYRKFRVEPEVEKKLRVMKFFNKGPMNAKIEIEDQKFNEMQKKKAEDEKHYKALMEFEKIREYNKPQLLSQVAQFNHRSTISVSLIQGQPHFFNYIVNNDSLEEELYHIIIHPEEPKQLSTDDKTVTVINTPEEWSQVVDINNLMVPNDYKVISADNYFTCHANESIPIVIKLVAYKHIKENSIYNVIIHKKNGTPLYYLQITIEKVFPIIDHLFVYDLPGNTHQAVPLVNPFKEDKAKTLAVLNNVLSTDGSVNLEIVPETYNFKFQFTTKEEGFIHEFLLYFYTENTRSELLMTWKFELHSMNVIDITTNLGNKTTLTLYIDNDKESSLSKTLQLFSSNNQVIFFPEAQKDPFTILPNQRIEGKYVVYPKNKSDDKAVINCVNCASRELFHAWLVRLRTKRPEITETVKVECKVGSITYIKYEFENPMTRYSIIHFDSSDEEILKIVDAKLSFNAGEGKLVNICIPAQFSVGRAEVLVFAYDEDELFSRTLLFQMNYK